MSGGRERNTGDMMVVLEIGSGEVRPLDDIKSR